MATLAAMLALAPAAQAQSLPGVPAVTAEGCERSDVACGSGAVIKFSWTAPSDTGGTAITGYDYQLKATTESAYGPVTNVGADVLSAEPSGLGANTAYDFQVRAKNSDGDGDWVTLRVSGRPAAPGGLAVDGTRTGGSEVTLTWSAPSAATAITAHYVEHRLETSSDHADWVRTAFEGDPAPTTGTVMGLEPGTEYEFRIRADTEHRQGWYSGDDPYPTATTLNESAAVASTAPDPLTEQSLDGATLTVDVSGVQYAASLNASQFTLSPPVSGLTVSSVIRDPNNTRAELTLGFTGDLAADTDLAVVVAAGAHTGSTDLTTGAVTVSATRTVALSVSPNPVAEGSSAAVTATITPAPASATTLTVSAAPVSPTTTADFTVTGSTLIVDAGRTDSTGTVTITANEDTDSDDEQVTVSATVTGGHAAPAAVTLTIDDVALRMSISGETEVSHPENWPGRVAKYSASSPEDAAGVSWSLSGADASRFSIDSPGGVLRFSLDPPAGHVFSPPPDYEDKVDDDGDGVYAVTVRAQGGGASASLPVRVRVTDKPEPGVLTLSSTRPGLGDILTATLVDPDEMRGAVTWQWERSVGRGRWEPAGTAATYQAGVADAGRFLRVTATYTDGPGTTANRASAETKEVVTAELLSALSASTGDSGNNPDHALKPAFNPTVLHYSIGCTAGGDTMTITPTAAAGVRLSIDGTSVASGATRTVAVDDGSEVRITLADATGAATHYFVRCTPHNLLGVSVEAAPSATEDLLLLGSCRGFAIIDTNGATRWYRNDPEGRCGYSRVEWIPGVGYRYLYPTGEGAHAAEWRILDENLENLDLISTVTPLKTTNPHDARMLDNGNFLLLAYEPAVRDLSGLTFTGIATDEHGNLLAYTFGAAEAVWDSAIQIRTPGGVSLFDWSSWDAIPFEDCGPRFPPAEGPAGGVGYAHINTMQMIDGDIVASFRGCNQVLRIDPEMAGDHKVVWRLGLTNLSDEEWEASGKGPAPLRFVGDTEGQFCGQHGSALLPNGRLLLFDNGVECMTDPWTDLQLVERTGDYSRAVEYALDHDNGEAVFVRDHSLGGTRSRVTQFHGHVEALDNGDWLVSWGGWFGTFARGLGEPHYEQGVAEWPPETRPDTWVTQVDPDTGEEKLSISSIATWPSTRALPLSPTALADVLRASFVTEGSSVRHAGSSDRPTVVVAFNRPVRDFTATASVSIVRASVESIAPLVGAGAPAHAYLFTLVPDGDAAITFRLLADQDCADSPAGVCAPDGTKLTVVPDAAHTIPGPNRPPITGRGGGGGGGGGGGPTEPAAPATQRFEDVDADSVHAGAIAAIAEAGITRGCDAAGSRFCPDDAVTRAQMASFLAGALDLPATATDYFSDDDNSSHEAHINALRAAGITRGCDPDRPRFCPGQPVTRAQMASFLVRALDLPATAADYFSDDDDSSHEANINALRAVGITRGCDAAGSRFCPDDPVTRAQMATFLARALNLT